MSNLEQIIKNNMNNFYYDNAIYWFSEKENKYIDKVNKYLKKDYGFLDIILNFDDYNNLNELINNVPDENKSIIKNCIIQQYLYCSILKNANIDHLGNYKDIDVNELYEKLFSKDFNDFWNSYWLEYLMVEQTIREKAKKETDNGYARIHLFLDNVNDIYLQKSINDLIMWRGDIAIIGYATKELLSYETTNNSFIESVHDYTLFTSNKKNKELKLEMRKFYD